MYLPLKWGPTEQTFKKGVVQYPLYSFGKPFLTISCVIKDKPPNLMNFTIFFAP